MYSGLPVLVMIHTRILVRSMCGFLYSTFLLQVVVDEDVLFPLQDVIAQVVPGISPLPTAFECEYIYNPWGRCIYCTFI